MSKFHGTDTVMFSTISQFLMFITVIVVAAGILYVLRKQGNAFVIADNVKMHREIAALKTANRYLFDQMQAMRESYDAQIKKIQADYELIKVLLGDSQQESRDLKTKNNELFNEIQGLRSALKKAD
ncbi:MAG: hypothetical protein DDT21_02309 [Syntrophomonadaceae bacterium]|nr:hypothetical protein [Bacillota bacterium]